MITDKEIDDLSRVYKDRPVQRDLLGRIIESCCSWCGRSVFIEHDVKSDRFDNKRIYHPDEEENTGCLLRCYVCKRSVHKYVKGAEFGDKAQ